MTFTIAGSGGKRSTAASNPEQMIVINTRTSPTSLRAAAHHPAQRRSQPATGRQRFHYFESTTRTQTPESCV